MFVLEWSLTSVWLNKWNNKLTFLTWLQKLLKAINLNYCLSYVQTVMSSLNVSKCSALSVHILVSPLHSDQASYWCWHSTLEWHERGTSSHGVYCKCRWWHQCLYSFFPGRKQNSLASLWFISSFVTVECCWTLENKSLLCDCDAWHPNLTGAVHHALCVNTKDRLRPCLSPIYYPVCGSLNDGSLL